MRPLAFAAAVVLAATALVVLTTYAALHPCQGVDAESFSRQRVSQLIALGWYGEPNDGREALYPPECFPRE